MTCTPCLCLPEMILSTMATGAADKQTTQDSVDSNPLEKTNNKQQANRHVSDQPRALALLFSAFSGNQNENHNIVGSESSKKTDTLVTTEQPLKFPGESQQR